MRLLARILPLAAALLLLAGAAAGAASLPNLGGPMDKAPQPPPPPAPGTAPLRTLAPGAGFS